MSETTKEPLFLLYSVKWTKGDVIVWWRPKSAGYTTNVDDAGRYSMREATEIARGGSACPVPEDAALERTWRCVSVDAAAHLTLAGTDAIAKARGQRS